MGKTLVNSSEFAKFTKVFPATVLCYTVFNKGNVQLDITKSISTTNSYLYNIIGASITIHIANFWSIPNPHLIIILTFHRLGIKSSYGIYLRKLHVHSY